MALRSRIGRMSCAAAAMRLAFSALFFLAAAARANTITVNSTADVVANDGQCTLREAIIAANTNTASGGAPGECAAGAAGLDTIQFNISGSGVHTINVTLAFLPDITEPVTIDGYTQSGSSANSLVIGDNAVLTIVLSLHLLNGFSFQPGSAGSTVRGFVINNSPDSGTGIIVATDDVAVEGNFIGTDATGAVAVPTNIGVLIKGGSNARIGGTTPAQRNLVSGTNNAGFGNGWGIAVELTSGGTLIQGNYIGTDATGTAALGNTIGILISPVGATSVGDVTIGGTAAGAGNLISGNDPDSGISLSTISTGSIGPVTIQGNIVGLDATGTLSLPNHIGIFNHGVGTRGLTLVGGGTPAARNIISANLSGVYNELDTSMVILGNYIGTDVTGTFALGNRDGIDNIAGSVSIGSTLLIGRAGVIAGNLISGNSQDGIQSAGPAVIQGNFIGTHADGVTPLPNSRTAILIQGMPVTIGGTNVGEGNLIVHVTNNAGVIVQDATQATIRGNSITANGTATQLGISLGDPFVVTPNDACDADVGSNNQQNFPVLTSAVVAAGSVTIGGTLNSSASTTFSVDLYSNVSCSPLGNGEGLTFLGSTQVTTDGSCNGTFSVALPVPSGQTILTATATDPGGNTSEFSACFPLAGVVVVDSITPTSGPASGFPGAVLAGSGFAVGATATVGGVAASGVVVNDPTHIALDVPALTPGTVNPVTVTVPGPSSGTLTNGWFADFLDVPGSSGIHPFVEKLARDSITTGCGGGDFCPGSFATRAQMAVFLLRSNDGPLYVPPPCVAPTFGDVPCSSGFAPWVDELAARGVTAGCGGGNYCPGSAVTRAQMAVFLLRTKEGSAYTPPACVVPTFADVPCSSGFAPWVDELAARGITAGCGGGNYCPGDPVTRGQMAVFLSVTFSLP